MIVLIASQATADTSAEFKVISGATVALIATIGIDTAEDTGVQIKTSTGAWVTTGLVLSKAAPLLMLSMTGTFRVDKPVSLVAYAVELIE